MAFFCFIKQKEIPLPSSANAFLRQSETKTDNTEFNLSLSTGFVK